MDQQKSKTFISHYFVWNVQTKSNFEINPFRPSGVNSFQYRILISAFNGLYLARDIVTFILKINKHIYTLTHTHTPKRTLLEKT